MRRTTYLLSIATLLLAASAGSSFSHQQLATALRVESLNRTPVRVRVITTRLGSERTRVESFDTVLVTPDSLTIPDSISRIHVLVSGYASAHVHGYASVRVILKDGKEPSDSLVSVGRDITLARKNSNARFARVWTAQPLVP